MGHRPIEDYLPMAGGSIYRLVRLAANRALELSEGKPSLLKNLKTDKVTTIALEEIAAGLVGYEDGKVIIKGPEPVEEPEQIIETKKGAKGAKEAEEVAVE